MPGGGRTGPRHRKDHHDCLRPKGRLMADVCCFTCKGAYGICLTGYRCEHHVTTRRTEDADDKARRTVRRPTEDQAIANVMREKRKGR
jgi:hypothetical protein